MLGHNPDSSLGQAALRGLGLGKQVSASCRAMMDMEAPTPQKTLSQHSSGNKLKS